MATFTGTTTPPNPQDSFVGADDVADTFRFTPLTLEAADTVIGGSGEVVDTLQFIAAGAIALAQFTGVSGMERILHHAGGNSYALTAALVGGAVGGFEARGGVGADSVDGSGLLDPAHRVTFFSGGGGDTMRGGAGNDSFTVTAVGGAARLFGGGGGADLLVTNPASWAGTDVFQGGSGTDRILFNAAGIIAAAMLAGLQSVEEIQLANAVSFTLALDDAAVAQAGGPLKVLGGANGAQLVDATAVTAGAVTYVAATGADTFLGGAGDDRYEVTEATSTGQLGAGDDALRLLSKLAQGIIVDGGAGYDVIELFAGGLWDLTGLVNFEEVELLAASTLALPGTSGFRVMGSAGRDVITLGGPGQVVAGFGGDDIVAITAATMLGAVLNGGSQASQDVLRLAGAGLYDFRRATIAGFEKIEQLAVPGGVSTILLANGPIEVQLRHQTEITLGADPTQTVWGSWRADTIRLGATGQFVEAGAGNDTIAAAPGTLGAGTILAGGPGFDVLRIELPANGLVADLVSGAVLAGVERIEIAPAQASFGLDLTLDATLGREIVGGTGADTVTAGAPGIFGTLGNGNDLLRVSLTHLAAASAETMDGGAGSDTLVAVDDSALSFQTALSSRFTGFERIDLSGLLGTQVTLEGAEGRHVLLGASNIFVTGSAGDDVFESDGALNNVFAGDGNDTIIQTVAPNASQVLVGVGGTDEIVYDRDVAGVTMTTMPTAWAAETVRLLGAHNFTANLSAGIAFIGDPTLGNIITLRGNNQSFQGGSGADTMLASSGNGTTLAGGEGADMYQISTAHQALWNTPGRVIMDTPNGLNEIRITGIGHLAIDFHDHTVQYIDRIVIFSQSTTVDLTLTAAMAATADGNSSATTGDFFVSPFNVSTSAAIRIDAGAFEAGHQLRLVGFFNGADTVIGGEGADSLPGGAGADLLIGNGGTDSLIGEDGADTIMAGDGADTMIGGAGGDVIDVAEDPPNESADLIRYTNINDGTVDINDSIGVNQNTADSIGGFDAATDKVQLSRAGLGLGTGGVTAVPANGFWDIGASAVFLFESDSVSSDTLNSNNFADFNAISFAINFDNGNGGNSNANRTVALLISNPETEAVRATGIYVWTDVDGDTILEASDIVRLLGVLHGVSANQLAAGSAVQIIA